MGSRDPGILLKPYLNVRLHYLASLFSLPPVSPVPRHALLCSAVPLVRTAKFLGMYWQPDPRQDSYELQQMKCFFKFFFILLVF